MHTHNLSSLVVQMSMTSKDLGQQLSKKDCLSALDSDGDFSCIVDEGDFASAMFCSDDRIEVLTWSEGKVNADYPSVELIEKLDRLASQLDAQVVLPRPQ